MLGIGLKQIQSGMINRFYNYGYMHSSPAAIRGDGELIGIVDPGFREGYYR